MAPRRYKPRKPRRGGFKPRRYAKKRTVLVNRALSPIPQRYITKLKFSCDVTTNASGIYLFNLNSMWDPTRVGGASPPQPYGRDTLAGLYNRYRVISAGWRISSVNDSSGTAVQLGCVPSNSGLTIGDFATLREMPRAKYVVQHSTGDPKVVSGKVHIPSLVGRSKTEYMSDDRYQAIQTSSPDELALLTVAVANSSGNMITTGRVINCVFEYTVEWFDINMLLRS